MRSSVMPDLLSVARIVFAETRASRRQLHAVRSALGCDATFEFDHTYVVSGGCPCVDEFVDVLVSVWRYLSDRDPATVRSYGALARTHCRLRAIPDAQRRRRGRQSIQKPEQLAVGAIGRALDTDRQRALLVDIVSEAGSAAPLDDDEQLLRRLAELRAGRFGGSPEAHLSGVYQDLLVVRDAADEHGARKRDSAGILVSWWEYYVESGLGKRERLHTVPVHETDVLDRTAARAMDAVLDRIVATGLAPHLSEEHALALADIVGKAGPQGAVEPVRGHLRVLAAMGAVPPGALEDDRLGRITNAALRLHRTVSRLR